MTLFWKDGILGNWLKALLLWTRERRLNITKRLIYDFLGNNMQGRVLLCTARDCRSIISEIKVNKDTPSEGTRKFRSPLDQTFNCKIFCFSEPRDINAALVGASVISIIEDGRIS
jgi:hypothetical protein